MILRCARMLHLPAVWADRHRSLLFVKLRKYPSQTTRFMAAVHTRSSSTDDLPRWFCPSSEAGAVVHRKACALFFVHDALMRCSKISGRGPKSSRTWVELVISSAPCSKSNTFGSSRSLSCSMWTTKVMASTCGPQPHINILKCWAYTPRIGVRSF